LSELVPPIAIQIRHAVTQFNMKWVEPAGLVKFDFLGLKTLTVLDVAVKLLKQRILTRSGDAAARRCPSYQMLARGDVVGVFQVESQACGERWSTLRPDRLRTSSAGCALSAADGEHSDLLRAQARRRGAEYLHPMLEPILKETFGVTSTRNR